MEPEQDTTIQMKNKTKPHYSVFEGIIYGPERPWLLQDIDTTEIRQV